MDADLAVGQTLSWPLDDVLHPEHITQEMIGLYSFRKNTSADIVYAIIFRNGRTE
jgi:hypothetical protein